MEMVLWQLYRQVNYRLCPSARFLSSLLPCKDKAQALKTNIPTSGRKLHQTESQFNPSCHEFTSARKVHHDVVLKSEREQVRSTD
jgi:hypothetical protein